MHDTSSLMHEDAQDDIIRLSIEGIDAGVLDVSARCAPSCGQSATSRAWHGIDTLVPLGFANAFQLVTRGVSIEGCASIELACQIIEDLEGRRGVEQET